MKPLPVMIDDEGERLIRDWRPTFHQGFKDQRDMITPIALVPKLSDVPVTAKPTIYFSGRYDDDYFYFLYCAFHFRDWTSSEFNIMQDLDSHHFDFEGALYVRRFDRPSKVVAICTVFHKELMFFDRDSSIWIEPEGHGMIPAGHKDSDAGGINSIRYVDYDLENINSQSFQDRIPFLRNALNPHGVHLPDQWNHWLIRKHCGKESDGLIYTNPRELFRLANKRQITDIRL